MQPSRPSNACVATIVREQIQTLLAQAAAQSEHGFGYPAQVKREFERVLTCGIFAAGLGWIQYEEPVFDDVA
jgi:hypothetical protein